MNRKWDMLRAAIPFFDPSIAKALEATAQMGEIQDLLAGRKERTELAICGSENQSVDMEGLFRAMREFCSEKDRRMVDMLLNIFQMKRMMEMMQMMQMAQQAAQTASEGGNDMDAMMEFMKSSMPKEQQENFDMLQMALTMMKT